MAPLGLVIVHDTMLETQRKLMPRNYHDIWSQLQATSNFKYVLRVQLRYIGDLGHKRLDKVKINMHITNKLIGIKGWENGTNKLQDPRGGC